MDFAQAEALAKIVAAFGAPFWAGTVLWLFYQIWKLLRHAIEALKQRDDSLQKLLDTHIATTDKRLALMEQLLNRHEDNIETLWDRLDSGSFRNNARP